MNNEGGKYNKKILWLITDQHIGSLLHDISQKGNFENFFFVIETEIDNKVTNSFREKKAKLMTPGFFLDIEKLLKKIGPDILVMGHDNLLYERTFLLIAKKLGIKTALIQEGGIPYRVFHKKAKDEIPLHTIKSNFLTYLRCGYSLIKAGLIRQLIELAKEKIKTKDYRKYLKIDNYGVWGSDKIFVMGDYFKKVLLKKGVEKTTIEAVGSPIIDRIFNKLQRNEIKKPKNIILFIDEPQVKDKIWTKEKKIKFIKAVAGNIPSKFKFLIKKHPRSLDNSFPKDVEFFQGSDIHEAIYSAKGTLGIESTALIESVLLGVPCLNFPHLMYSAPNIFTETKITYFLKSLKELSNIEAIIKSENKRMKTGEYKKIISSLFYKFDNGSARRIANCLADL